MIEDNLNSYQHWFRDLPYYLGIIFKFFNKLLHIDFPVDSNNMISSYAVAGLDDMASQGCPKKVKLLSFFLRKKYQFLTRQRWLKNCVLCSVWSPEI